MYPAAIARILLLLGVAISTQQTQTPVSPPTRSEVQVLLQSSTARDQAWGTFWAARLQLSFPEIRKNLEAHLSGTKEIADFAVIDNSLDALIQTFSEPLPLELIEAIYRNSRKAEALILLTRVTPNTATDDFLIELLDEEAGHGSSLPWYSAADIMLKQHRLGLIHSLLHGLTITGYVVLCDSGNTCRRHLGSITASSGTPGVPANSESIFPPWPYYVLTTTSSLRTPLADRPIISYRRSVGRDYLMAGAGRFPSGTQSPPNPSTRDRLQYVAAAAPGVPMTIMDDETLPVVWTNNEAYRAESEGFETGIRSRYAASIEQLRDRGFLTSAEFDDISSARLKIVVDDQRSEKTPLQ